MDWLHVLSTAIGTLAGTLLTVIVAWCIYKKEKKDIAERNRKQHIVDTANRSIQLISSINATIINLNSTAPEIKKDLTNSSLYSEFNKSASNADMSVAELENNLLILENISKYELVEKGQPYINKATQLIFGEMFYNEEKMVSEKIDNIRIQGDKLVKVLQVILKENIE
ncbi:hypothetical protein [Salinicoccus albus]|uniref:hypothetical protein n=1 Tax=Salinicoccus albus TaxID=418756 RepID=UPI00038154F4|nr:hypothetical protein [Salinicoccus albus]